MEKIITVKIEIISDKNIEKNYQVLPKRQTCDSCGYDLYFDSDKCVTIAPKERRMFRTGIKLEIPKGYYGEIVPRSGLASKLGITVLNSPGTIDCLSGDTVIHRLNETNQTIRKLTERSKDKYFWVYSIDKNGWICPGLAHHPRNVGKKSIIKIIFDNGRFIKCTADHKIRLWNGLYKKAGLLTSKDSLSPLATDIKFDTAFKYFSNIDNMAKQASNCKVIKIKEQRPEEVFDLSVNDYHNFAANGIFVHNCDYRGEIIVLLINLGHFQYTIHPGDRIAQIIFKKHEKANFKIVHSELSKTERSDGGFGHTGR